jgi:uncharacterized membrane protein YhaH (DUF805 family)
MGWRQLLFSLDGRISRHRFWTVFLLPSVALNIIVAMVASPLQFNKCMFAFWAAALWPCIAVGAKRCHDRNRSGWFQLISLVPIVGALWLLFDLGILRGTDGPNRFGPAPLR